MFVAGCRETISIVTACDDGYAQHAHVLVESMVSNNPDHDFRVFVLVPAGFRYAERLDQLESHPNCQIRLIEIDPNLVRDLHVSEHISHAAYFRLLIDDVLPRDLQRVLYFDADIVIAGDVLPLWQIDLDDNIVAAVADATPDEGQERRRRVVLTGGLTYYNSGVMLIDLDRWREEQVTKKALAFCRAHPERLKYWAQCALNYVLAGDVLSLNVIWNFQNSHVESEAVEDASSSLLRRGADRSLYRAQTVVCPLPASAGLPVLGVFEKDALVRLRAAGSRSERGGAPIPAHHPQLRPRNGRAAPLIS